MRVEGVHKTPGFSYVYMIVHPTQPHPTTPHPTIPHPITPHPTTHPLPSSPPKLTPPNLLSSSLPSSPQVLYQLKILTTALFSVAMLKKKLSLPQWISLLILFAGAAIVQLQEIKPTTNVVHAQSKWVGLIAVIVSCVSSGFAGVYFEMVLKESDTSVWMRNVQLGIYGSSTAVISMMAKDGPAVMQNGFFYGYSPLVWMVVIQQAVGGLIVALVVCYADNILKGFATSLSIILSCVASIYLFRYSITLQFALGALLVIAAVYLYSYPSSKPKPVVTSPVVSGSSLNPAMKSKTYSLPNVLSKE